MEAAISIDDYTDGNSYENEEEENLPQHSSEETLYDRIESEVKKRKGTIGKEEIAELKKSLKSKHFLLPENKFEKEELKDWEKKINKNFYLLVDHHIELYKFEQEELKLDSGPKESALSWISIEVGHTYDGEVFLKKHKDTPGLKTPSKLYNLKRLRTLAKKEDFLNEYVKKRDPLFPWEKREPLFPKEAFPKEVYKKQKKKVKKPVFDEITVICEDVISLDDAVKIYKIGGNLIEMVEKDRISNYEISNGNGEIKKYLPFGEIKERNWQKRLAIRNSNPDRINLQELPGNIIAVYTLKYYEKIHRKKVLVRPEASLEARLHP